MPETKTKTLTVKERKFADAVLAGRPLVEAAEEAGYRAGTRNAMRVRAHRISEKAHVKAYMAERLQKNTIDADYVLQGIKAVAEDPEAKHADKLRAFELLGKHLALFTDKTQVEHGGAMKIEIEYIDGDK